ncbi:MAG: methyltransferase family protein [Chthoniobacteraceae bacterium]
MITRYDIPTTRRHGSPLATVVLALVYVLVHSGLASQPAKQAFERIAGTRARNGLYRPFFIVQAVVTTVAAVLVFRRVPDRDLYRAPWPWSGLLRLVQLASLALLGSAVKVVGFQRLTGLAQISAFLRGEHPEREPEAQGPPPTRGGQLDARGPFRYIRHPDNLPIITLLWSFPRMTLNRAIIALISSVYAVLGSWHEDARLRRAYDASFERYMRTTPLFIPRLDGERAMRDGD